MLDRYNHFSMAAALTPRTISSSTTTNGTAVDLMSVNNGSNSLVFAVEAGTITDGTYVFKLQDSLTNGSDWVDVPSTYVQAPASVTWTSATTSGTCLKLGYLGNAAGASRYVRLVVTSTSVTSGAVLAAVAILGLGQTLPAA